MSFDLYFFNTDGRSLEPDTLAGWAAGQPHMTVHRRDEGVYILYENIDTGVAFPIDYQYDGHFGEDVPLPERYADSGLAISLNYLRPAFFAYETMPVVARLADAFDLLVSDAQAGDDRPRKCDAGRLIASWIDSNDRAIPALSKELSESDVYYLPRQKAEGLWSFNFHKAAHQSTAGSGVFVPNIFIFAPPGSRECVTAITWTESLPTLVPPVDHIIMAREDKRLFGLRHEESVDIFPAETLMDAAGVAVAPFGGDDSLRVIDVGRAPQISAALKKVASRPLGECGYTRIPIANLVDVPFLAA